MRGGRGTDQCCPYAGAKQRILLALRAGWMSVTDLRERFGENNYGPAIRELSRAGLVEFVQRGIHAGGYQITPMGRATCPSRRQVELHAPLPYANMVLR